MISVHGNSQCNEELPFNIHVNEYVGFEVLTAIMKSSIFWDIAPCSMFGFK
jgi:hypothetical protein